MEIFASGFLPWEMNESDGVLLTSFIHILHFDRSEGVEGV